MEEEKPRFISKVLTEEIKIRVNPVTIKTEWKDDFSIALFGIWTSVFFSILFGVKSLQISWFDSLLWAVGVTLVSILIIKIRAFRHYLTRFVMWLVTDYHRTKGEK